jgi:hypothetical protein
VSGEREEERKAVGEGGAAMDALGPEGLGLDADEVGVGVWVGEVESVARRDM